MFLGGREGSGGEWGGRGGEGCTYPGCFHGNIRIMRLESCLSDKILQNMTIIINETEGSKRKETVY